MADFREFSCNYCGYIYAEAAGDPENGVPAGTLWHELPEDWCCPHCSAEKDGFVAV